MTKEDKIQSSKNSTAAVHSKQIGDMTKSSRQTNPAEPEGLIFQRWEGSNFVATVSESAGAAPYNANAGSDGASAFHYITTGAAPVGGA